MSHDFVGSCQYKLYAGQSVRAHSHDDSLCVLFVTLDIYLFVFKRGKCEMRHRPLGPGELCAKILFKFLIVLS